MFVVVSNKLGKTLRVQEFSTKSGAIEFSDRLSVRFTTRITDRDPRKVQHAR